MPHFVRVVFPKNQEILPGLFEFSPIKADYLGRKTTFFLIKLAIRLALFFTRLYIISVF